MPMAREDHETLLNELLDQGIEHSRRTEILQQLRVQHSTDLSEFETLSTTNTKLQTDNNDLIVSNSKLFRQVGVVGTEKEKELDSQEKSKTITIEDLEKGAI